MKTYHVLPVTGQPHWDSIPRLEIDHWNTDQHPPVSAWAQLAYDSQQIWVHLAATENSIRAQESGPLARTWEDSCLEFFFCPLPDDDTRYINIEMTPTGAVYLGVGPGDVSRRLRLIPRDPATVLSQRPQITHGGWELFYTVPFELIRTLFPSFEARPGLTLRANCYKCGDLTDHPHYLSWSPITGSPLSFHRPQDFGQIIFK